MAWSAADIPDQSGRTVVITGGNSGIGYPTALELAKKGAEVHIAARDATRGEAAVRRIQKQGAQAHFHRLDLGDLDDVARFVEAAPESVDVLINNAGIMMTPPWTTKQGYEAQWGINVVGHAQLTKHLLGRVTDRVVTISSIAHQRGRIIPESWRSLDRYQPWWAYSQSKLGNLLFAQALDRRLDGERRSVAAHPGISLTRLSRDMPLKFKAAMLAYVPFLQSAARGALPTLYAATQDVPGGSYWGPRGFREWRGAPGPAEVFLHAQNEALQDEVLDAVWNL